MKRCPECRRDYYDETLLFCLDDGTALLAGPASGNSELSAAASGMLVDEPQTAILHETASPAEAQTRAQIQLTDQTAIYTNGADDIAPPPRRFDVRLIAALLLLALIA